MSDELFSLLLMLAWINGIVLGYVVWAPETRFKQNFVDGLTLRFLWGKR